VKIARYLLIIIACCVFTSSLNVLHSLYILDVGLIPASFIIPVFAGMVFGALIAHVLTLSSRLTEMAYTDSLTRIYNRMYINRYLETEMDKVRRYGGEFSLIFFDIDHFKAINDRYGHQVGDDVLRGITRIVDEANRSSDVFARYGGEEFLIYTASTDLAGAMRHAERLRADIASYPLLDGSVVSCSFGVAQFDAKRDDLGSLIRRVDMAMYQAKREGRNRVVALTPDGEVSRPAPA
jgi:diguanylate cyclase (GGDEF)-like protein